ncbi:hypothetical protein QYE76_068350 [Lolium multiflorum]|uniref:Retrotransposon protein, putative, Ty1-copia subclass n=1 Tax=Lolium multiflorum TaxID=4521 RepID=A0AAD8SEC7_LOLMU|nr:hypothetical protein QYE76_068350 [Lolium multiflorum]
MGLAAAASQEGFRIVALGTGVFATKALSRRKGRYQSDPGMEHWTAVKNIMKYLKRTKDMFLCYGGDQELVVTSYTDASWNTDPDDSKSRSGYVFILNGVMAGAAPSGARWRSLNESRIHSGFGGFIEAVWMKRFIVELGVVPSALDPLVIYCDNMGAIANAQEPRSHKKLKHIKLHFHSIREYIEDGEHMRSPAGVLHHHRHHAVVLPRFRGGSTTSAARWNGEEDVVFINTVRVTSTEVLPDCGTVKIFYALAAASDRLHPPEI